MDAITKTFITEAEYLKATHKARTKSEYYNGEVIAKADVFSRHTAITAAIIGALKDIYAQVEDLSFTICIWLCRIRFCNHSKIVEEKNEGIAGAPPSIFDKEHRRNISEFMRQV